MERYEPSSILGPAFDWPSSRNFPCRLKYPCRSNFGNKVKLPPVMYNILVWTLETRSHVPFFTLKISTVSFRTATHHRPINLPLKHFTTTPPRRHASHHPLPRRLRSNSKCLHQHDR